MGDQVNGINNPALATRGMDNAYTSMVQLSDMAGDSIFDGMTLGGLDSAITMPPSLLEGNLFNGLGGFYGPTQRDIKLRNSMTSEDWALYQAQQNERMSDFQLGRQVRQAHNTSTAQFRVSSADNDITKKIGDLQDVIHENEQDEVLEQYQKIMQSVYTKYRNSGYSATNDEVRTETERLYYQATIDPTTGKGKRLFEDIKENGSSSFVKGLKEGFGCGLGYLMGDEHSAADNIAIIKGRGKASKSESASRWTGRILSGALSTGAVIGTAALCGAALVPALIIGGGVTVAGMAIAGLFGGSKKEHEEE